MEAQLTPPCFVHDSYGFWAFVIFACIAHGRQTVLLLREAFSVVFNRPKRGRRRTDPR
jgi:hypothetical protein